tara:strand:+ start:916 stop:1362 length:447 start_codon:yes stop_codon:yes gene_type:complete
MSAVHGLIPFVVADYEGNEHTYEMTLMPAGDGMQMSYELMGILAAPLAALSKGGGDDDEEDAALADLLGPALSAVEPTKLTNLSKKLLATVTRDGSPMRDHALDVAYRGNYTEMLVALSKVILENRFIPLLDGWMGTDESDTTTNPAG